MKALLISLLLTGAFAINAQTSVIGVKSHHGDIAETPNAEDKFGEMAPIPVIDTLIKINGECVIQIGKDNGWGMPFQDTVCGHWYYKQVHFDAEKVQQYHGSNVELIGFDDDGSSIQQEPNPAFYSHTNKLSSKWLFIILALTGLGVYLARPVFSSKSKS